MILKTYDDAARIAATRKRKIDNNTYLVVHSNAYALKLHDTEIVQYWPDRSIELYAGGWRTPTTKARMNDYTPASIWQGDGLWTCQWMGKSYPYADHMRLYPDGTVMGYGIDPNAEKKLRAKVRKYVKAFVEAFDAGDVVGAKNTNAVCIDCEMGSQSKPHLLAHLEDNLFSLQLLKDAVKENPSSQCMRQYVSACMGEDATSIPSFNNVAKAQLRKSIFDYIARRLDLTPGRTMYERS